MHGTSLQGSGRIGYTQDEIIEMLARVSHEMYIKHRKEIAKGLGEPEPALSNDIHPHDVERAEASFDALFQCHLLSPNPATGLFEMILTPDTP